MAPPGAAGRRLLWALCPGPGPARALPRAPGCGLSTKTGARSVLSALASGARRLGLSYERFLERTFPRFYVLHATFTRGVQAFFLEVKEVRGIKWRMSRQQLNAPQLPYRDMERLRQFRRDLMKAVPLGVIAVPPFTNFLVFVLMYFFPRQLLIRHFWTPRQQVEFREVYDAIRRVSYPGVVQSLALAARSLPEPLLQRRLEQLCMEVQRGSQPRVAELCALRSSFAGSPLALSELPLAHVKALSRVLFLTPHLPAFFLRRRLRSHVLEIRHLDRALLRLGLGQLSEEELRAACYLRGLNSTHLDMSECRAWMEQWLRLSCTLEASEASLLANSMVLLSLNYIRAKA